MYFPLTQEGSVSNESSRIIRLLAAVLGLSLLAAACGSSNSGASAASSNSGNSTSTSSASPAGLPSLTLNGSGATFPAAFYEEVLATFDKDNPGVTVNYNPVGSGQGQSDLAGKLTDFAGSDSLVKDVDKANYKGGFLYIPTVAAPITVSYNLKGVDSLQLSPKVLAGILQTDITSWDDAAIAADNPGLTLPSTPITVVHRSDGSGTTANFTHYLDLAVPDVWKLGTDKTVNWPSGTIGAQGNTGVADRIKNTDGAIGYVDFADARATGLTFAAIKNKDGNYVVASLDASSAALNGAVVAADLTYNPLNAAGAGSYPIVAPTYILTYKTYPKQDTVTVLQAMLRYLLGPAQDQANALDFAKLPEGLRQKALAQVDSITVG